ncbi:MAG TPA: BadF/BadG/BcrA/BcrD ATPase family protein [Vicinamibacteria bacterium]|nr:BadF/BadG/BcrA/BcrD ATPase family protein [Vicinamibacteria bacterium]
MTSIPLLLAVDGGGTSTQALVTDLDGQVLARGLGPSSNLHNVGFERACAAIATAVGGALAQVRAPHSHGAGPAPTGGPGWGEAGVAAACLGLSGVDSAQDEAQVSRWVEQQGLAGRFVVVNDSELILAGGTPAGWGVALISGTGSVCLGRDPSGRTARVGGWGPLLGDEGSGYHIAGLALERATQAADGRIEAPGLLKAVLRHWAVSDPTDLIRLVHAPTTEAADIARMATVVLDLAGRNDAAAREVVAEAARDLALHVDTIVRQLGLTRPPLAMGGGMLLRSVLRRAVLDAVKSELGPVTQVSDPPAGAVVLARRLLQGPEVSGRRAPGGPA